MLAVLRQARPPAGCVVTDLGGLPRDRGAGGLLVASDAETHAQLLGIAKSLAPDNRLQPTA